MDRATIARRRAGLAAASKHPQSIALLRRGLHAVVQRPDSHKLLAAVVAKVMASGQPDSFKASFIAELDAVRREASQVAGLERRVQQTEVRTGVAGSAEEPTDCGSRSAVLEEVSEAELVRAVAQPEN